MLGGALSAVNVEVDMVERDVRRRRFASLMRRLRSSVAGSGRITS